MPHRNKPDRAFPGMPGRSIGTEFPALEFLGAACRTDRENEATFRGELTEKNRRHLPGSAGAQDGVEAPPFRPGSEPVSVPKIDVGDPESRQGSAGGPDQLRFELEGTDLARQFPENGALVAAACPHLQDPLPTPQPEQFGHHGDDVRLRDGLIMADWQGAVIVGAGPEIRRDEFVAGNAFHRSQDPFVPHPPPRDLVTNHPPALLRKLHLLVPTKHSFRDEVECEATRRGFKLRRDDRR